jgi:hypothetical protein
MLIVPSQSSVRRGRQIQASACEGTQLRRANWSEVGWMGKEACPFAIEEFMEVNVTMCSFCLEIGRWTSDQ